MATENLLDVIVDEALLKLNPEFIDEGIKIGDVIQVDLNETVDYEPTPEELQKLIEVGYVVKDNPSSN